MDDHTSRRLAETFRRIGVKAQQRADSTATAPSLLRSVSLLTHGDPLWGEFAFTATEAAFAILGEADHLAWLRHIGLGHADAKRDLLAATIKSAAAVEATTGGSRVEADSTPPDCRHSPDFRSVAWFGASFSFTANQAAVVRLLWQAWENGTPERDGLSLLVDADVSQTRFDHVFKSGGSMHPAWKTLILQGATKGSYRLADGPVGAKTHAKTHG